MARAKHKPLAYRALRAAGFSPRATRRTLKNIQDFLDGKDPDVDWPEVEISKELTKLKEAVSKENWDAAADIGNKIDYDLLHVEELTPTLAAMKKAVQDKNPDQAKRAIAHLIDAYNNWQPATLRKQQATNLATIESISPVTLKDMPDEEILSLHRRMHQLWGKNFAGNRQERAGQLVREDIWNAHQMIVDEMRRRGMDHDSPLDSRSEQATRHLPAMITVIPQFVSIVGSTAVAGSDPNRDIDVLIRSERQDGKFLIWGDNVDLPLRKVLDPDKLGQLHFIANPQGPHAESIPLYDLVLWRSTSEHLELASRPGLYLVEPHGEMIHRGDKRAIVKSRHFDVAGQEYVLVSGDKAYGIITLNEPKPINLDEFVRLRDQHLVSDDEREKWWPDSRRFWYYEIKSYKPFDKPRQVNVPAGVQTFIRSVKLAESKHIKIDLGCGNNKPAGYIGVDCAITSDADIYYDLEYGLPFPSDYADEIRAHHILEHLSSPAFIMYEIWRVLKPGGIADIVVPSTKGDGAFAHPHHKSFWNAASFYFYEQPTLRREIGFSGAFEILDLQEVTTADSPTVHAVETRVRLRAIADDAASAQLAVSPWYTGPLPKPAMKFYTEFFSIDELWNKWAKNRIKDGLMVEEKLNGFRALLQKRGDQIRLSLLDESRRDHAAKFPQLVKAAKKIPGDFILDGDLAVIQQDERWPRPKLMTLMAAKPRLPEGAHIVFTAFDILYHDEDLTNLPLSQRRLALERLIRSAPSRLLGVSQAERVSSRSGLERAGRRLATRDMSEGIVAKELESKYPLSQATSAWAKVKHIVEIKAIVLEVKKTKSGAHSFRGGLLPGNSDYPNLREHAGIQYVDLGFSFNAPFAARAGDIVTFQIQEIILQDNGELAWLGAKPLDVDRDRNLPYTAPQVIDLARRGHILQDTRKAGRKRMAITEELRRRLEAEAEETIYAALQAQFFAVYQSLPDLYAPKVAWDNFFDNAPTTLADVSQALYVAIFTTLRDAAQAGLQEAHADRDADLEDIDHWARITAYTLATGIIATTLKRLARYIRDFLADNNYNRLLDRIAHIFGRGRANLIAETEVTRGLAYGYAGTEVIHPQPPAHVDCRCYLASRPNEDGTYDIVWVTQNDELVCPICEPLHNRTVGVTRTPLAKAPENEGDTRGERAAKFWKEHWHESFPKDGQAEFVYQHHWRGLTEQQANWPEQQLLETSHSVHGDLRLSFGAALWGFTCFLGTTKDAKARDLPNLPHDDALEGNFKFHQPKAWLTIARQKPFIAEPGDIGSTTQKWSKFFEIDHGTYQVGVWHKHFFEIFLHGKKIKGRYTIQFAKDPTGRRYWQITRPKDQIPFADKHDKGKVIKERKKKGDRWLVWSKPGQKPELIDLKEARDE